MVLLPLGALGALGATLVADQRRVAEREVDENITRLVETIADSVGAIIRSFDRELWRITLELPLHADMVLIRESLAKLPRAMMVILTDEKGGLLYPPPGTARTGADSDFLDRVAWIWKDGSPPFVNARDARNRTLERGWIPYRVDGQMYFLRWQKRKDYYVAFEVNGGEIKSELIAQLPGKIFRDVQRDARVASQTVLKSAYHETIYVWGERTLPEGARFRRMIELPKDLGGWTLQHYSVDSPLPDLLTETLRKTIFAGLTGLAAALGAGAWLIWLARTREMRVASQRVSFVNQVSHELKTPLTNIRMHAELLADLREGAEDFDDAGREARYLKTIARESERLSRLITNVLSFARGEQDKLDIRLQRAVVDEIVAATLVVHEPALKQSEIELERSLEAGVAVMVDADALGQILTNLISNIEKYGKQGKWMRVATALDGERVRITVQDRGPGIPEADRDRIFEPFWRASDKASDGVSGTGIGLDIARRLARLHGGDLRLIGYRDGATFEVELRVGRVDV